MKNRSSLSQRTKVWMIPSIVGNKIPNEVQKALIRNIFPAQIAEQMCNAIDGQESRALSTSVEGI